MGRQRFTVETIVRKLREAEVDLSRGQTVTQVCRFSLKWTVWT